MNELLEVLKVQGVRIALKINVKNSKSLRLGIRDNAIVLPIEKVIRLQYFIIIFIPEVLHIGGVVAYTSEKALSIGNWKF